MFQSMLLDYCAANQGKSSGNSLSEAQASFATNRGTENETVGRKYDEFWKPLYICYVDFRKAFDSVWRYNLWH